MERSRMYKNQDKDGAELRRRRQDESLELRKAKKSEVLHKRRNLGAASDAELTDDDHAESKLAAVPADTNQGTCEVTKYALELIRFSQASDVDVQALTTCVENCRRILSRARDPPIAQLVQTGAVPVLVALLRPHVPAAITFEACWALTNVASGSSEHTKAVIEAGGVEVLIPLLEHPMAEIAEQAVWALGNIAGESSDYRDLVINNGIVEPLIKLFKSSSQNASMLSNIAWVFSNLCRSKGAQPTPLWVLERIIPFLAKLILQKDVSCPDAQLDALWALSYASETSHAVIPWILNSGVMKKLISNLSSTSLAAVNPSLRCMGNLVTGDDELTDAVLKYKPLNCMNNLLKHSKPIIVKEACWLISNITAGTVSQIQQVIDANILPNVMNVLVKGDSKSQREALWALSNLVYGASPEQLNYVVSIKLLTSCVHLLKDSQPKLVVLCLEMLERVFKHLKNVGSLEEGAIDFESAGGVDTLESLQEHENDKVYTAALKLVEEYFSDNGETVNDPKEFSFVQAQTGTNNQSFNF